MVTKEQGEGKAAEASEDVIYKIDVPANRSVQIIESGGQDGHMLVKRFLH